MAQHDQVLADQAGAGFRADLNNALAALFSNSSGTTEPTVTVAYQLWADTTAGQLKIRNAANSGWITIGPLGTAALGMLLASNNLSDLASAATARTNLGAAASGAATGSGLTIATARLAGRTTAGTGALEEIAATEGVQITGGNLKADVNGLTEDTTPDTSADFALVWDASASAHKKVKLNKFSGGGITLGTAVASTSGTSIDFTGIPSTAKRVRIMFQGVSTNGTSPWLVQIGNGSIVTTGYVGHANSGAGATANGAGFNVNNNVAAANTYHGEIVIGLIDTNVYTEFGIVASQTTSNTLCSSGGSVSLGGVMDRVRITTAGGSDTFDAGKINISYE